MKLKVKLLALDIVEADHPADHLYTEICTRDLKAKLKPTEDHVTVFCKGAAALEGWGDDITWVQTYEEGLYKARKSNKPLMVILHLEDCKYCQALKKVFAENDEVQAMADKDFIMLNLMVSIALVHFE
ncbi:hypothetical protein chiPu_0006385 [Chiloscyllium punctatum]|uniref:Uncharacterized protein n=1 Tax=Chiloscyllium punctatum TaxID=137246 RepID=A0A401SC21_CHIPU|nr:hypothetical protein [Chiloscyllium punctatum]